MPSPQKEVGLHRTGDGDTSPIGSPQFLAGEIETQFLIDGKKVRESAPLLPDPVVG